MNKWSVERWAASTGLGFAILLVVGSIIPGNPKKWNASAAGIQSFLQGKHKELVVAGVLFGVGYILFLWFLASFAGMFREAGQGRLATIVYGAGVATIAISAIGDGIQLGLEKVTYNSDPNTVATLYGVGSWIYGRLFWTMAALALATWLATKRSKVLPDWYAWLTLLGALVFVLGGVSLSHKGFFSITGGMGLIGFFAIPVWVAISSLLLVQRLGSDAPAAAAMG
ncbi:MAG TPA: hypothetical protein VKR79_11255 [Gaiellaceae bacterium]|nr:hypothetical protein [Gaiellaceae bacterium]